MEYLQLLSTKQVDGIILCSLENPWEDVEPYLQHGQSCCVMNILRKQIFQQ